MQKEIENLRIYKIANYIGNMLENGIMIGDNKMRFTMLDYYCLTDEDIYSFIGRLKNKTAKEKNPYLSYLTYFAEKEGLFVREVDGIDEVLDEHHAFIINGQRFEPTKDDILRIFNLFSEYHIPKYSRLIYLALHRMVMGNPILPLVMQEEKTKRR